MKIVLCLSSIAVILFSGLYLYQENVTPEWRVHQLAYLDQIDDEPVLNTVQEPDSFSFDTGLKQIWLPEMNRVDRCISCHVAIENFHFEKKENPLKFHPEDYLEKHDPEKHGCTICHDGQGRAVNFKDAAADDPDAFWNKPLLRKPFLEANCYRCHVDLLDQTPAYNLGKQTFESSGCLGCHKRDKMGGFLGPELRGIGDANPRIKHAKNSLDPKIMAQMNENQNLAYIYEAVRFPKVQPEESVMFDFQFSHKDAKALTIYLKSFLAYQTGTQHLLSKPVHALPITEKGKKTFQLYCTACHGKNGMGGVKNPNYLNDTIPNLNRLSEQMFLYNREKQDAVVSMLNEFCDLLQAGAQPNIPGFFKVIAKYMSVKNIILNGRIVEKKNPEGAEPIHMPAWGKPIPEEELSSLIAYLIVNY